ncbi:hypothetical protein B0H17DRAFT_1138063 [Mycena rosella]|uniref:Uncharacterized protein n=1 Tax=Mycena rosella TaxID=1033263 RepID=A0AAD7GAA1_MYCRO|nr:hypothetical protein B0H17DRAFT_1138063 [Mycena rosella]
MSQGGALPVGLGGERDFARAPRVAASARRRAHRVCAWVSGEDEMSAHVCLACFSEDHRSENQDHVYHVSLKISLTRYTKRHRLRFVNRTIKSLISIESASRSRFRTSPLPRGALRVGFGVGGEPVFHWDVPKTMPVLSRQRAEPSTAILPLVWTRQGRDTEYQRHGPRKMLAAAKTLARSPSTVLKISLTFQPLHVYPFAADSLASTITIMDSNWPARGFVLKKICITLKLIKQGNAITLDLR